jgi:transposase InsO family protein
MAFLPLVLRVRGSVGVTVGGQTGVGGRLGARELRRHLQDRADRRPRLAHPTQLELAIVEWVAWFNTDRLHESLDDRPPAEVEALYDEQYGLTPSLNQ